MHLFSFLIHNFHEDYQILEGHLCQEHIEVAFADDNCMISQIVGLVYSR